MVTENRTFAILTVCKCVYPLQSLPSASDSTSAAPEGPEKMLRGMLSRLSTVLKSKEMDDGFEECAGTRETRSGYFPLPEKCGRGMWMVERNRSGAPVME
jgi:hypothetical protein